MTKAGYYKKMKASDVRILQAIRYKKAFINWWIDQTSKQADTSNEFIHTPK